MSQSADIIFLTYYFLPSQDTSRRRSLDALFTHCASTLNRKEHHKNQHEDEYSIDTSFTLFIKITIILFTIVYFPQLSYFNMLFQSIYCCKIIKKGFLPAKINFGCRVYSFCTFKQLKSRTSLIVNLVVIVH
jgi:hypothetical protein